MAVIYLAGGCFWGMQGYFDRVKGVLDSSVGYANSKIANPSYELVCSGISGAVEALKLEYDESVLSLREIMERFLSIIDPCALNYQGNDRGTQYNFYEAESYHQKYLEKNPSGYCHIDIESALQHFQGVAK